MNNTGQEPTRMAHTHLAQDLDPWDGFFYTAQDYLAPLLKGPGRGDTYAHYAAGEAIAGFHPESRADYASIARIIALSLCTIQTVRLMKNPELTPKDQITFLTKIQALSQAADRAEQGMLKRRKWARQMVTDPDTLVLRPAHFPSEYPPLPDDDPASAAYAPKQKADASAQALVTASDIRLPEATAFPEVVIGPEATPVPEANIVPDATIIPGGMVGPGVMVGPEATTGPEATIGPETTTSPEATIIPEAMVISDATIVPDVMVGPDAFLPEAIFVPGATIIPEAAAIPEALAIPAAPIVADLEPTPPAPVARRGAASGSPKQTGADMAELLALMQGQLKMKDTHAETDPSAIIAASLRDRLLAGSAMPTGPVN